MKLKTTQLAALAATAILGWTNSASAATIIWSTPVTVNNTVPSQISNSGTTVLAYQVSTQPDQTLNSVTFSQGLTQGGVTLDVGTGWAGTYQGFTGDSDAYLKMLNGGYYGGSGTVTLTLSNLTIGQNYQFQFWVADYRGDGAGRTETLTGGSNTSASLAYDASYVIGTFAATDTNQTVVLNSSTLQLNALQLRAIPEASTALLGGLGMLALLRRRRA